MKLKKVFLLFLVLVLGVGSALAVDPVAVSGIVLNESAVTVAVQKSVSVKATVEPKNATNKKLMWTSSDEGVAKVSNGKVTGVGAGTATITVEAQDGSGVSASVAVTVVVPVKKIVLSEAKSLSLPPLVPWRVTAQAEPENATTREIVWSTSDEKVASVDQDGTITGVSPGTAAVTAAAADGCGAKAAIKVKVEKYDVVFESKAPQPVEYTTKPGASHIRGKAKTGNVSVSLDYTLLLIGSPYTETTMVTPVKAGPDVVTITGGLRKETYKVFVSPAVFPESGAAPLEAEEGSAGEILFLDIPWGSSYPEAKSILQGQGKKVKAPAQRNDYIRAVVDGEVLFSACTAEMAALEFSYEPGTTDFKEKNSFFRGVLYFSPDTPFDQIRLAVRSIYGLDNGELQDGVCTWNKDGVVLKLTPKDKNTVLEFYQE